MKTSRRFQASIHCVGVCAMLIVALIGLSCGTPSGDPADAFIAQLSNAPPERRPPEWEKTVRLMARAAPSVGEIAPDFALTTPDGGATITRSSFQAGRPLVLIFGSFT